MQFSWQIAGQEKARKMKSNQIYIKELTNEKFVMQLVFPNPDLVSLNSQTELDNIILRMD